MMIVTLFEFALTSALHIVTHLVLTRAILWEQHYYHLFADDKQV